MKEPTRKEILVWNADYTAGRIRTMICDLELLILYLKGIDGMVEAGGDK